MNPDTKIYFSFSAKPGTFGATIFQALFAKHRIDAVYLPRKAPDPKKIPLVLRALGASGCAISSPWKESIIAELDEKDPSVRETGSCNTLVLNGDRLSGYNTDIYGTAEAVHGASLERVVVYGAGGVVPSVVLALRQKGAKEILLAGRDPEKVRRRADSLKINTFERATASAISLLVHCTPSKEMPEGISELAQRSESVFDLVVSPQSTALIAHAKHLGKKVIPGWRMAAAQLQKQFELYEKIQVPLAEIETLVESLYLNPAGSQ